MGFSPPNGASDETKELYKQKLVLVTWSPADAMLGHGGDHLGASSTAFVKVKLAPIVMGKGLPSDNAKNDGAPAPASKTSSAKPSRFDLAASGRKASAEPSRGKTSDRSTRGSGFFGWTVGRPTASTSADAPMTEEEFRKATEQIP